MTPIEFIEKIKVVSSLFNGNCYKFHLLLKEFYPQAIGYHDSNHVITEIDGKFYDKNGEVEQMHYLPIIGVERNMYVSNEDMAKVN